MRRAAAVLVLLPVLALVVPPVAASEAADCAAAPVPTRAPEASDAAAGILPQAHAATTLAGSDRADARVNVSRLPVVNPSVTVASVEAVFVADPDVGTGFYAVVRYGYDLVGTRNVTCFTWPAPAGWSWRSVEVWANATTGDAVALDLWLGA